MGRKLDARVVPPIFPAPAAKKAPGGLQPRYRRDAPLPYRAA